MPGGACAFVWRVRVTCRGAGTCACFTYQQSLLFTLSTVCLSTPACHLLSPVCVLSVYCLTRHPSLSSLWDTSKTCLPMLSSVSVFSTWHPSAYPSAHSFCSEHLEVICRHHVQ